jgi:uncharacterized cupin superfamily protein
LRPRDEVMASSPQSKLELVIEEPYAHEAEEFVYVLAGELLFVIDGVDHRLGPGDSIHFQSTIPHSIHNDAGEPVEAVWVLTPRLF